MWIPQSANSSANPSGIWERVQQGNGRIPVNWRRLDFYTLEPKARAYYVTVQGWCLKFAEWYQTIRQRKQRRVLLALVQLVCRGVNLIAWGLCRPSDFTILHKQTPKTQTLTHTLSMHILLCILEEQEVSRYKSFNKPRWLRWIKIWCFSSAVFCLRIKSHWLNGAVITCVSWCIVLH